MGRLDSIDTAVLLIRIRVGVLGFGGVMKFYGDDDLTCVIKFDDLDLLGFG